MEGRKIQWDEDQEYVREKKSRRNVGTLENGEEASRIRKKEENIERKKRQE